MGSLSKEDVMAAILAQNAPVQPPPQRNALQKIRDLFSSAEKSDTSVAAYRKYAMDMQSRGEQPMSEEEWRRQQMAPKNALTKPMP